MRDLANLYQMKQILSSGHVKIVAGGGGANGFLYVEIVL